MNGIEVYLHNSSVIRNPSFYFSTGVAFSAIGAKFSARVHREPSIFGNMGSSIFYENNSQILCFLNTKKAQYIMGSMNPGVHFEVGDVNRLPLFHIDSAESIYDQLNIAFTEHESHREPSVEFKKPGHSCWDYAQEWAQTAVDRPQNTPLPTYNPVNNTEPATAHISYALGVALGRFKADGTGIIDPRTDDLSQTLPHGILFLNGTLLDSELEGDSLGHAASFILHEKWKTYGHKIDRRTEYLRDYLRERFFGDVHLHMYEKSPIHWPLSSENKTFVVWVNIHRMDSNTLERLEAFYLKPTEEVFKTRIRILFEQKSATTNRKKQKELNNTYSKTTEHFVELQKFISMVRECATNGPPPTDTKCLPREKDANYDPKLDDGVMVNSAALWPLLEPQWKTGSQTPKKWWKELCNAAGKKDYDWSHLAMKYWPTRVDKKCKKDPSLGITHGCLWKYHPEYAWRWELRLQNEISSDFVIEETDHEIFRYQYIITHSKQVIETIYKEVLRREKKESGVNEITLNRSGLWFIAAKQMWKMEDTIALKLYKTRENSRKKAKKTTAVEKEIFIIHSPDRDEMVARLVETEPNLQRIRKYQYKTTEDTQENLL